MTNAFLALSAIVLSTASGCSAPLSREVLRAVRFGAGQDELRVWYNNEMGDPTGLGGLAVSRNGKAIQVVNGRVWESPPALLTFTDTGRFVKRVALSRWVEDAGWPVTSPSGGLYLVGIERTDPPTQPWSEGPEAVLVVPDDKSAPRLIRKRDIPRDTLPNGSRLHSVQSDRDGNVLWL